MEYVPGEIAVKFKSDVGEDAINTINSKCRSSVKRTSRFVPEIKVLNVPVDKTVEEMVRTYENLSEVKYA